MKKLFISTILLSMSIVLSGCTNAEPSNNGGVSQNNETTLESQNETVTQNQSSSQAQTEDKSQTTTQNQTEAQSQATTQNTNKITIEKAKQIALNHANLTSDKVSFIKSETEFDDGIEKYNIEFYYENKEYDYEINAVNGQIIGYDYDVENYSIPQNQTSTGATNNITTEKAKEIALNHANLTSSAVVFEKIELDTDNGVQKYEIEFYHNNIEYNYEIDATSGKILSYEQD